MKVWSVSHFFYQNFKIMISLLDRVENWGKKERHFFLFPQCQAASSSGRVIFEVLIMLVFDIKIKTFLNKKTVKRFLYPQRSGGGILESPWLSDRLSICPWTQFCRELFSYSFAHTALKFIHNVCIHMKLCMCNFHDHTIIGCGIISPWT